MPQGTSPTMRGSPQLGSRPINTSTSPVANKQTGLSALVNNKSLTIIQTNKRQTQNNPVQQQINNNVTISPIGNSGVPLNNSVQIMKMSRSPTVASPNSATLIKLNSKNNQNIPITTAKPLLTKSPITQKSSPMPSKLANAPTLSASSLLSTSVQSHGRSAASNAKPGPQFTKTTSAIMKQNQNQMVAAAMARGNSQAINQTNTTAQMNSNIVAPRPILVRRQTQTGQPLPLGTRTVQGVSPRTKPEVKMPLPAHSADKSQPVMNRRASICTTGARAQQLLQMPQMPQMHYSTRADLNSRKRPGLPIGQPMPNLSNFIISNELSITAPKRQKTSDMAATRVCHH